MTALFLAIERLLVWLAVLASAAMMLLTSADAGARYLFNAPIIGAYEVTEKYLMPAAIFLGFSWAYRGGVFIRVTFLIDKFPAALKRGCDYLAWAISLACCAVFVFATSQQAARSLAEATTLSTIAVPLGPAYIIGPVGFFVLCVMMLVDLPRVGHGDAMLFSQDAPTT
jgi:TRAP-type C4-dicarboxylate transport system permease small subunit